MNYIKCNLSNKYIILFLAICLVSFAFEILPLFVANISFLHSRLPDLLRYDVNFNVACLGSSLLLVFLTYYLSTLKRQEIYAFVLIGSLLEAVLYIYRPRADAFWLMFSFIGPGYFLTALLLAIQKVFHFYRKHEYSGLLIQLEILGLGLCMPCIYALGGGLIGLRGGRYVYDGMLLAADSLTGTQPAFIITELLRTSALIDLFMHIVYDYLGIWLLLSQALVYVYERSNTAPKQPVLFFPVLTYAAVVLLGMRCYAYFPAVGTECFCGTAVFPHGPYPEYSLASLPHPIEAPPFLARNAMPSLHLSWIICAYLGVCSIKKSYAYVGLLFVLLTLLSAFSVGCHWLTDFVVALPFSVLCAGLTHLRLNLPYRLCMLLWGGGVSCLFMYYLKHSIDLILMHPHYYLFCVFISSAVSVLLLISMVLYREKS